MKEYFDVFVCVQGGVLEEELVNEIFVGNRDFVSVFDFLVEYFGFVLDLVAGVNGLHDLSVVEGVRVHQVQIGLRVRVDVSQFGVIGLQLALEKTQDVSYV